MNYREVPSAGFEVSEIGFGCGGNAGLMIRGTDAERLTIVSRALDLGINYFDTAPDYGDGIAEENLGRILRDLSERPLITSKVEVRKENLGDIADHVVRSVDLSLKRLGVDYLDVLQIHNGPKKTPPKLEGAGYGQLWIEDFLKPGGALEGLTRVVRAGKARALGFICRGGDVDDVRELLNTGAFHMLNVHYTLLNPTAGMAAPQGLTIDRDFGAVLNEAHERGIGTAIYSPLASGALTDQSVAGVARHPLSGSRDHVSDAFRRDLGRAPALSFLSEPGKQTLAQAAFRFVLMHPGVSTVIGGFSSLEQLEELCAVSDGQGLSAQAMARIEDVWRRDFAK